MALFTELGVPKEAAEYLKLKGFEKPFAIQATVMPLLLRGGKDVLVSAATGSGKTLAYLLPMVTDISRTSTTRLRGLIVMPTRELVDQAREICELCVQALAWKVPHPVRKKVKIGMAAGNHRIYEERTALMIREQIYDRDEYNRRRSRENSLWESPIQDPDSLASGEQSGVSSRGSLTQEISCTPKDYDYFHARPNVYELPSQIGNGVPLPNHIIEHRPNIDILICTPGRLVQHIDTTPGFTLDFLKWLVIDEADKLLEQSFQQWLEIVMACLDKGMKPNQPGGTGGRSMRDITKVVVSATVTRDLGQLSALRLHSPKLVLLEGAEDVDVGNGGVSYSLPETLQEFTVPFDSEDQKPLYLIELLRSQNMVDELTDPDASGTDMHTVPEPCKLSDSPRGVLIFTKSNEAALRLSRLLVLLEPALSNAVGTMTSTVSHAIRKRTLRYFQERKLSILVASDLIARGLDICGLLHVINYDRPSSTPNYIHRVGRTARAGKEGKAWTLMSRDEMVDQGAHTTIQLVQIDPNRNDYEAALRDLGQEAKGFMGHIRTDSGGSQ